MLDYVSEIRKKYIIDISGSFILEVNRHCLIICYITG